MYLNWCLIKWVEFEYARQVRAAVPCFELACGEFCAGGSAGEYDDCRFEFYGDRKNEL